jgi:hypothetical protein
MSTNTNTANTPSETVTVVLAKAAESFDMTAPETFSLESPGPETSAERKKLRPLRFATGLCLTTLGMGMVLFVGVRMLEVQQVGGDFALLIVAGSVLTGVILLGGGFGLMATASSGFDEQEFDRLARAGNISAVVMSTETKRIKEDEMAA